MSKKLLKINVLILTILLSGFFFLTVNQAVGLITGFLLSLGSVLVSSWIIESFWEAEFNQFNKIFFFSLFIRFFVVVGVLALLLGVTKIDEIYFTVSFIISYLCHSITEMIFFNKILQKQSSN